MESAERRADPPVLVEVRRASIDRSVTQAGGETWERASAPPVEIGCELADRYVVQSRLGLGGTGVVFRAWDTQLSCSVAIKVFDAQLAGTSAGWRRLVREVRLARGVRHPHVCPVFDLVNSDGRWFVTMELGVGTLRDWLEGPSDAGEEPAWKARAADARAVCDGLAAIHGCGITHGDLTPRNILRMGDGRLALADFGMAREDDDATLVRGGTLSYLAPEVMLGARPDRRSDIWQLGIVLHEILLGLRPSWLLTGGRPIAQRGVSPAPPPEIEALLAAAAGCLAWDPTQRPASVEAVLALAT